MQTLAQARVIRALLFTTVAALAGCGASGGDSNDGDDGGAGSPAVVDRSCDLAVFPSPEWTQCELENYARTGEGPAEQAQNPAFMQRWTEQSIANQLEWVTRGTSDVSWFDPRSGNTQITPLCTSWSMQCVGDPFRYPAADGLDGQAFYEGEAEVQPVVYYDEDCARISGRVWAPRGSHAGSGLPAVVIENGSVQAPETLYWWAAQILVRAGYVVMTSDPRGQGRSDQQTPTGEQGSNANIEVFTSGLVNAIDFFRSSSVQPYPHNLTCADTYPTPTTAFNPFVDRIDRERLGIAGHSAGADAVLNVQGFGAAGADPWPGQMDASNPVDVGVAWDSPTNPNIAGGGASELPGVSEALAATGGFDNVLHPRVPLMEQQSEYGLAPVTYTADPDVDSHKVDYTAWTAAGLPVVQFTIRGSTHYEWSLLPTFPSTSWCPEVVDGRCSGGWGLPVAAHYTLAWFDRWLKQPGEAGYDTADARLLADGDWAERFSFHFRSARSFATRGGSAQVCEDIRAGC